MYGVIDDLYQNKITHFSKSKSFFSFIRSIRVWYYACVRVKFEKEVWSNNTSLVCRSPEHWHKILGCVRSCYITQLGLSTSIIQTHT